MFSAVISNILENGNKKYKEFKELVLAGIKLYLPYEIYLSRIHQRMNTKEFNIEFHGLVMKYALVLDANEYNSDGYEFANDSNVLVIPIDWSSFIDIKSRLRKILEIKKMITPDELVMHFRELFDSQKDYEEFVKYSFMKITLEVHPKNAGKFNEWNPGLNLSLNGDFGFYQYQMHKIKQLNF